MGKVALWGAAGVVGESIAAALRAEQRRYRVVGRERGSLERSFGSDPLAEIVHCVREGVAPRRRRQYDAVRNDTAGRA